jgi:hypothetical protein
MAKGQIYVVMPARRVRGAMILIAPVGAVYEHYDYQTISLKHMPTRSDISPESIRPKPELAFAMEMK